MAYVRYKEVTKHFNFTKEVEVKDLPSYILDYVYDDETFYRINNAFYLRPGLYQRRGKTWDDFGKDYSLVDEKYFFTTRFGFTPIRVVMYQCF